jgi:hypothetical protein
MSLVCQELGNTANQLIIRKSAGIALKNALTAKVLRADLRILNDKKSMHSDGHTWISQSEIRLST